jgi:enoyl-CoA hydratase
MIERDEIDGVAVVRLAHGKVTVLEIMQYALGTREAREAVFGGRLFPPQEALARGLVHEVTEPDTLLDRALAETSRLATMTPADTFAATKRRLQLGVLDRLARHRTGSDPEVVRLWELRAADGWIRGHITKATGRS